MPRNIRYYQVHSLLNTPDCWMDARGSSFRKRLMCIISVHHPPVVGQQQLVRSEALEPLRVRGGHVLDVARGRLLAPRSPGRPAGSAAQRPFCNSITHGRSVSSAVRSQSNGRLRRQRSLGIFPVFEADALRRYTRKLCARRIINIYRC